MNANLQKIQDFINKAINAVINFVKSHLPFPIPSMQSIPGLPSLDFKSLLGMAGINLDDTTGAGGSHGWEAKVRFGLLLNNEGSITTANDAVGFGAREANGGGVGAGHAKYPGILNSQEGTIWIKGR